MNEAKDSKKKENSVSSLNRFGCPPVSDNEVDTPENYDYVFYDDDCNKRYVLDYEIIQ